MMALPPAGCARGSSVSTAMSDSPTVENYGAGLATAALCDTPVTKAASSEHRYAINAATSSGFPRRPIGIANVSL